MSFASTRRALEPFKRLLVPGRQMPVYVLMFVTNRCNARCGHCFYWRELNTGVAEELTLVEYDRLAASLGPLLQITFTGGSPELRKDLPDVVERFYTRCRPTNMTFCMLGHATDRILAHTEEILRRCRGQKVKIGISLDGLDEEHDRLRGITGLFPRVVETIRGLGALKVHYPLLRVDVGLTVHGLNYETVGRTARWVRDNLPVDVLKPILVRGDPRNPDARDEICKTTYLDVVNEDRQWLQGRAAGRRLVAWDCVVGAKELVQREFIAETSRTGRSTLLCAGGRETAVIYPGGDVAGCELRDDTLGNLRAADFDFRGIWLGRAADRFRETTGATDACRGCYHHCFMSPALFRTPRVWPRMMAAAWTIYRNQGA
ncbi:MAG: radical SAM protein [Methylotetracoccus sp.]